MTDLQSWASALEHDASATRLLIFADFLEEQGDARCEGVREFLVREGKRPEDYGEAIGQAFTWWEAHSGSSHLPTEVVLALRHGTKPRDYSMATDYPYGDNRARAHLTALLDAAQAWIDQPLSWRNERMAATQGVKA